MYYHLVLILLAQSVKASPRYSLQNILQGPPTTATPHENAAALEALQRRQITSSSSFSSSTIGYVSGDPDQPFELSSGYSFRIDAFNEIWGTCTTTASVLGASDCMLTGGCYEAFFQTSAEYYSVDFTNGNAITCSATNLAYCGMALYRSGPDIEYGSWFCADQSTTVEIWATPTITPSSTTTSSASSSTSPSSILSSTSPTTGLIGQTPPPSSSSSKSKPKTSIIVGVLVPVLVLGALGAIILIRRYRKNQRRIKAGPQMSNVDKKEYEAFISDEPVELPTERRISELPAENRPVEVSAVSSPIEIGSDDALSGNSHTV